MAPADDFSASDERDIEFRETAGRAGDSRLRIHHQDQDPEFVFHDSGETLRRRWADLELGRKALSSRHRGFVARTRSQRQRAAQERRFHAHLRRQVTIGGDPAAGALLVLAEFLVSHARVAPGELPFTDEQEGGR